MDDLNIENLLNDFQERHSDFQIENFIIGGQWDDWSRYKQCLRELKSREVSLYTAINNKKIFDLKPKKKWWFNFAITPKMKLAKKLYKSSLQRQEQTLIKEVEKVKGELSVFLKLACKLKKQLGEITPEKRKQLEAESWKNKLLKMISVDFMVHGSMSQPTFEMLLSMPQDTQHKIFKLLENMKDNKLHPLTLIGMGEEKVE